MQNKNFRPLPAVFLVVALSSLLLSGCGEEKVSSSPSPLPLEISFTDFQTLYQANPKIPVLDVRTPEEYRAGHVPGTPLLPLSELQSDPQNAVKKLSFNPANPLFVICRSGNRSLYAARILRSQGFKQAVSVQGGMNFFIGAGLPVSKD